MFIPPFDLLVKSDIELQMPEASEIKADRLYVSKSQGELGGAKARGWLWYSHPDVVYYDGSRGCWIKGRHVGVSYFQPIIHDVSESRRLKDAGWEISMPVIRFVGVAVLGLAVLTILLALGVYEVPSAVMLAGVAVSIAVLLPAMLMIVHRSASVMRQAVLEESGAALAA